MTPGTQRLCRAAALMLVLGCSSASNPVVLNVSIADPHIHIFNGVAYM